MDDLAKRRRHIVTLVKNIKLQLEWKECPSEACFIICRFFYFLVLSLPNLQFLN